MDKNLEKIRRRIKMKTNKCSFEHVSVFNSICKKHLKSHLNGIPLIAWQLQHNILWKGLLFLLFTTSIFAQIPQTISYQGVLTDASGNVKADGEYSISFSLYENENG